MAVTLGTNIASYTTRMQLNKVSGNLSNIYERLSTGSKINSAKDDAAGLVISQNMEANILGSRQAMQNIQTAQSFLTIAEDGMVSISDHFQRINDLLTNMANDTNDIDSRVAAIREVIERLSEIDRLAKSTNFNGMCMLDGTATSIVVQMGPSADEAISTLDISKALSDCSVEAFDAKLPSNLDPSVRTAYLTTDSKWVYKSGNKYYYGDGEEYTGEVTKKTIIANPSGSGYILEDTKDEPTPTKFTGNINKTSYETFNPTNENCRAYMTVIQEAISTLAAQRGLLGAYENRMESSYDSLSTRIESLESAKVPYTDSDIAEEAASLTQQQILQQINVAVLSSANSSQQIALSLLGG